MRTSTGQGVRPGAVAHHPVDGDLFVDGSRRALITPSRVVTDGPT
jgi:hypothetical protein